MQALFSDRGWTWKALAALLAFAWCCHASVRLMGMTHAQPEDAALKPDLHQGKAVYLWAKPVLSSDPGGFEIPTKAGPVRVEGLPAETGRIVSASTRIAGPRLLRAERLQVMDGYAWKRGANYALSIVVVLAFACSLRRRWRWPASEGVFRERR